MKQDAQSLEQLEVSDLMMDQDPSAALALTLNHYAQLITEFMGLTGQLIRVVKPTDLAYIRGL